MNNLEENTSELLKNLVVPKKNHEDKKIEKQIEKEIEIEKIEYKPVNKKIEYAPVNKKIEYAPVNKKIEYAPVNFIQNDKKNIEMTLVSSNQQIQSEITRRLKKTEKSIKKLRTELYFMKREHEKHDFVVNIKDERANLRNDLLPPNIRDDVTKKCCYKNCGRRYFSQNVRRITNMIQLPAEKKVILFDRYIYLTEHYQRRNDKYTAAYMILHFLIQTGSILTPALLSIQHFFASQSDSSGDADNSSSSDSMYTNGIYNADNPIYWTTWAISVMVGLLTNYVSLFKIDKKYYRVKETYNKLVTEGWEYYELSGKYETHPDEEEEATHLSRFKIFCKEIENLQKKESRANYLLSKNKQEEEEENQKTMFKSSSPPPDLNKSLSDTESEVDLEHSDNIDN